MAMYLGKERAVILSQKYTAEKFTIRKTLNFGGLSQSTLFRVKKVKGATVKSKNLIPYPYYEGSKTQNGITFVDNGDGSITVNGTATESTAFYLMMGGSFSVGTYTISGNKDNLVVNARKNGTSWIEDSSWASPTGQFNEGDVFNYISIYVPKGTVANNIRIYPMLNEGETALPYQPYFTGLKHAYINAIKSTGKNLISYPFYQNGYTSAGITFTDNGDGSITVNGTATAYASLTIFKDVLKAGTYYLSGCNNDGNNLIEMYFATPDFRIYKVDYGSGVKIDLQNDETIMIVINLQPNAVANNLVFKPMLNYGSTAFPFEPYKEDTWQLPETLELGEWDELNPQTGEVKKATTYTLVCNGAENWTDGQLGRPNRFNLGFTLNSLPLPLMKEYSKFLSSYYKEQVDLNCNVFGFYTSSEIYNKFNGDVEAWKAHLAELYAANNPLVIEYVSGEPTIEKIEGCPLSYTAFKNGTETVIKGEEDNSQFKAIPTIETGHTIMMEIIGDKYE